MHNLKFRKDINGLRAYAVLLVVLFHFGLPIFKGGFVGVDIFFVISGFLMTGILTIRFTQRKFSLLQFYWERCRRIVPALLAVCLVLLGLGWMFLPPREYTQLAKHSLSAVFFVSNILFGFEAGSYFDGSSHEKWLLHTWSLSVEWQFYLIYPVLLLSMWRLKPSLNTIKTLVWLVFLFSLALSVIATPFPIKPKAAFYLLPTRAWEMLAGALVFLYPLRVSIAVGRVMEMVGLALILLSATIFDARDIWPGYKALLPVLGAVLVLLSSRIASPFTDHRLVQWVGNSSYSIYLWHWPVFVALGFIGHSDSSTFLFGGLLLSLFLGYLSFRFVEMPTKNIEFGFGNLGLRVGVALTGAVCVISALVIGSDGGISRLALDRDAYLTAQGAIGDWGHPDRFCNALDNGRCTVPRGKSVVYFLGDSHIEQIYPRYAHSPSDLNLPTIAFRSQRGCVPISGVQVVDNQNACASIMTGRWDEIKKARPEKLVIGAAWLIYFFDDEGRIKNRLCQKNSDGCAIATDSTGIAMILKQLEEDIVTVRKSGTDVYLLAPFPYGNVNFPEKMSRSISKSHLILSSGKLSASVPTTFSLAEDGKNRDATLALLQGLSTRSGAKLISTSAAMCPSGTCSYIGLDGVPIYKDAGHFTATYAKSSAFNWLDRILSIPGYENIKN